MNEVLDSIKKWFKEKTTSPLYGTFILSLILWNWKLFYILFWQPEDKLSLPKIEYAQQFILSQHTWWQHWLYFLIFPLLSTYFIIWWFPFINNWAHKKYLKFYYEKKALADEAQLTYEKRKKETLELISVEKKEQAAAEEEIKKVISDEERWNSEYDEFKNLGSNIEALQSLERIIYEHSGLIMKFTGTDYTRTLSSGALARLDLSGLIKISGEGTKEKVEPTVKGKFFLMRLKYRP